jgi:hypothetical protein
MDLLNKLVRATHLLHGFCISFDAQRSAYEANLLSNIGQVSSVENTMRSLSWVMPGPSRLSACPRAEHFNRPLPGL